MKRTSLRALLLILLCTTLLVACSPAHKSRIPAQTNDGWQTASLDEVGIDEKALGRLVDGIDRGEYENIHSVLIVKDGKLVFEEYFSGYTWNYEQSEHKGTLTDFGIDTTHNLASVTKSVTSALVGIAMDHGFIQGVDEKVLDFFPEYADLSDERKDRITLEHLLTMTAGLEWNEMGITYSNRSNDLIQLFWVLDPIEYILAKDAIDEPGTKWYYSGGCTNLLGEVIREATGLRMDDFAEKHLFAPLGITNYEWDHINVNMIHASGNLRLRPRDMAKLGYLFLRGGVWEGQRIVSQEWVEASTKKHVTRSPSAGYGYQWWLLTYRANSVTVDSFHADGWGGQRIIVFPSLDMVVVFTGGNYVTPDSSNDIISRHVLPALH